MLSKIKITEEGNYRAQVIELGPRGGENSAHYAHGYPGDEEPVVPVTLHMPLSDARRLGAMLFEMVELRVTKAELSEGIKP